MAHSDGAYRQIEEFSVTVQTRDGPKFMKLTHEQVEALHTITGQLLVLRDEARMWPFGELEKRQGFLPAVRDDVKPQ